MTRRPKPSPSRNIKPREQLSIDGTEPPRNKPVEAAIDRWLDARREQKLGAETTKIRHAKLVELMTEAGVDKYPYTDPETGKRKLVDITPERKAKTKPAPSEKSKRKQHDDAFDAAEREVMGTGSADPFAVTRGSLALLDEAKVRQADEEVHR